MDKINKRNKITKRISEVIGFGSMLYVAFIIFCFFQYSEQSSIATVEHFSRDTMQTIYIYGLIFVFPVTTALLQFFKWKDEDIKEMHRKYVEYRDRQKELDKLKQD